MSSFNESVVEQATLEWLADLGYQTLHGPDISPVWAQDRRTMPADLARYAELLAELRGCTVAEVIERTSENARRVLRL